MVDKDAVYDNGDEDGVKLPLSGVEIEKGQSDTQNKDRGGGDALFREWIPPPSIWKVDTFWVCQLV
jgi:hypothetical protein